jgi:trimeric autotransporter adhesin
MKHTKPSISFITILAFSLNGFSQNIGIGTNFPIAKLEVQQTALFSPAVLGVSDPGGVLTNGCGVRGINRADYGAGVEALATTNGTVAGFDGGGFGVLSRVGDNKFGVGAFSTNLISIKAVTETGIAVSANGGSGIALSTLGSIQLKGIGEAEGKILTSDASGNAGWQSVTASQLGGWSISGNAGASSANFLGTTDNNPLRIRTNSIDRMTILGNGNVGIGTTNPNLSKMEISTPDLATALIVRNISSGENVVAIDARTSAESGYAVIGRALGTGSGYSIPLSTPAAIVGYGQGDNIGIAGFSYSGTAVHALSYTGNALYTSGNIRFTGIGQGAGKILVSDVIGNASWQNPSTLTLDNASATGISQFEFRNNGAYRGAFGWSQTDGRFFFYDGESGTNTLFINNGKMGIRRDATTNALEVGGEASKSTAGSWLGNSDARLKKNIFPVTNALDKLLRLKGVQYEWNDDQTGYPRPTGIQMGFTAQNVQEVFPEKVSTDAQGFLQTAYGTYDPLIVEAIRELKAENELLKKELEAIKEILLKKD